MRTANAIARVVFFAGLGLLAITSASATEEAKCSQQVHVCTDTGPNGGARTCVTTVCTDSTGNIVSINTIVMNEVNKPGSGERNPVKLSAGATPVGGAVRRTN